MGINQLSFDCRGCIFEVFKELGPGLLETVYEHALKHEIEARGYKVLRQQDVPVTYKGINLDLGFRIDLLVEDSLIIEIKSVEELHNVHKKQLLTYLQLMNKKLGLLVNFNVDVIKDKVSLIRIIN